MNTGSRWVAGVVAGMVLLGGCTSQPRRVSCEDQLEPINAPAPKVAEAQAGKKPAQETAKGRVAP